MMSSQSLSAPSKSQISIPNTGRKGRDMLRSSEVVSSQRWVDLQWLEPIFVLMVAVLHFLKVTFHESQSKSFVSKAEYGESGPSAIIAMSPALL